MEKLSHDSYRHRPCIRQGQLTVPPCTDCRYSYEHHESFIPFLDYVFLPTYWGFACAPCIADHHAAECSFQIIRTNYRDGIWENIQVRIGGVGAANSKYLEWRHPLSS
jgi:hypothetical protein